MRSDHTVVNVFFGFWKCALTKEFRKFFVVSSEGKEIIDIGDLAEVRADWIEEDKLKKDVSFDEIESWLVLVTVQNIEIFHA